MSSPRIILADDHQVFAEGLQSLFSTDYDVVAIVGDGQALLEAVEEFKPDLVATDLSMPKLNGIECVRRLKATDPELKVVLLTMHEDVSLAITAMRAGASGYILKNRGVQEVLHAVRQALDGERHVSPQLADEVQRALDLDRIRVENLMP